MRHPPLVKSPMKAALLAGVALGIVTGCVGSVSAAMKPDKLQAIDREIEAAISRAEIPGAVLRIESKGEVYEKAYGKRLVSPGSEDRRVGASD